MNPTSFSGRFFFSLLTVFLLAGASSAFAVKVEQKNGEVYEGEILEQDATSIILESNGRILNIRKDSLKSLPEGVVPAAAAPPAAAETPRPLVHVPDESAEIERIHSAQTEEQRQAAVRAREAAKAVSKLKAPSHLGWLKGFSRETAAKNRLRKIHSALFTYWQENGHWPSGIKELVEKQMLEPGFASGVIEDYKFEIQTAGETFKVYALPEDPSKKLSAFTLDSGTGKIISEDASVS